MRYSLKREFPKFICVLFELFQLPLLLFFSFLSRFFKRKIDIGIGPDPLINNIFHKKALESKGFSAETFCYHCYYITNNFDYNFSKNNRLIVLTIILLRWPFLFCLFRYRSILLYFNGGPLYTYSFVLWKFEPMMYYLANIETVVLAYGGDVQDLLRTSNLVFRDAVSNDYPKHKYRTQTIRKKIDLWTLRGSHVIAGCDWVEYLYHWDSLLISHFCIDSKKVQGALNEKTPKRPFLILHAPNHRTIKGTKYIEKAVSNLKSKGLDLELKIIEKMSNEEVIKLIQRADLVIDQLVIGWYAMFAIEAMSLGKPVICNLRSDFLEFYSTVGLLDSQDCPIINASPNNVEEVIQSLYNSRDSLNEIGEAGIKFVEKFHSTDFIGSHFKDVFVSLGVKPSKQL